MSDKKASDTIGRDLEALRLRLSRPEDLSPEDLSSDWVKFANPERAIEELEIALDLALRSEATATDK